MKCKHVHKDAPDGSLCEDCHFLDKKGRAIQSQETDYNVMSNTSESRPDKDITMDASKLEHKDLAELKGRKEFLDSSPLTKEEIYKEGLKNGKKETLARVLALLDEDIKDAKMAYDILANKVSKIDVLMIRKSVETLENFKDKLTALIDSPQKTSEGSQPQKGQGLAKLDNVDTRKGSRDIK